jgi:hypothetical protein
VRVASSSPQSHLRLFIQHSHLGELHANSLTPTAYIYLLAQFSIHIVVVYTCSHVPMFGSDSLTQTWRGGVGKAFPKGFDSRALITYEFAVNATMYHRHSASMKLHWLSATLAYSPISIFGIFICATMFYMVYRHLVASRTKPDEIMCYPPTSQGLQVTSITEQSTLISQFPLTLLMLST